LITWGRSATEEGGPEHTPGTLDDRGFIQKIFTELLYAEFFTRL